jgi:hypothetical protein
MNVRVPLSSKQVSAPPAFSAVSNLQQRFSQVTQLTHSIPSSKKTTIENLSNNSQLSNDHPALGSKLA